MCFLPRDAEEDGTAVVDVLAAAEPPDGALRGGATQRVPWRWSSRDPEAAFGHGPLDKEPPPQARHVALPRDAEANGSAVVDVLGAAEPPGSALRGGATQRVQGYISVT